MKLIFGILLLLNFLGCFINNTYAFYSIFIRKKHVSFIPLIGGITGAIGFWLIFDKPISTFFWIFFILDLSFLAYLLFMFPKLISKSR